jgi:hypothetical protein
MITFDTFIYYNLRHHYSIKPTCHITNDIKIFYESRELAYYIIKIYFNRLNDQNSFKFELFF